MNTEPQQAFRDKSKTRFMSMADLVEQAGWRQFVDGWKFDALIQAPDHPLARTRNETREPLRSPVKPRVDCDAAKAEGLPQ